MKTRSKKFLLAATFLSILVVSVAQLGQALAQPSVRIHADFNGDGFDDLAVGVPGEHNRSGGVNIIYGSAGGLAAVGNQFFSQKTASVPDTAEAGDTCGAALAAGDFDRDGFADLAMGCPGEDVGSDTDFGAVIIFYGSAGGLSATGSHLFSFTDFSIGLISVADKCGAALAAGDFNGDGVDDLAVGCPGRDMVPIEGGGVKNAGRVLVLYGSGSGLTKTGRQSFDQGTSGVPDTPEDDDSCGAALAAGDFNRDGFVDLAMGCPGEDNERGASNIFYGSGSGLRATGSQFFSFADFPIGAFSLADMCGTALVAGDFNGDGADDLAMGCPGRDMIPVESGVGIRNFGRVIVLYGSGSGLTTTGRQSFDQDTTGIPTGIPDTPEEGDNCGAALAAGDFDRDGFGDLAIGCPGEDVGSNTDFGAVIILHGSPKRLRATGSQLFSFTDFSSGLISLADNCGTALAAGDFNGDGAADLSIGCPGRDTIPIEGGVRVTNFGRVIVLYGSSIAGLSTTGRQSFDQNTLGIVDNPENDDSFGFSLARLGGTVGPDLMDTWQEVVQTYIVEGTRLRCESRGTFETIYLDKQIAAHAVLPA